MHSFVFIPALPCFFYLLVAFVFATGQHFDRNWAIGMGFIWVVWPGEVTFNFFWSNFDVLKMTIIHAAGCTEASVQIGNKKKGGRGRRLQDCMASSVTRKLHPVKLQNRVRLIFVCVPWKAFPCLDFERTSDKCEKFVPVSTNAKRRKCSLWIPLYGKCNGLLLNSECAQTNKGVCSSGALPKNTNASS